MVDVGGHRLHIYCMGRGRPTVILDAGLGDSSATWDLVQSEVANFTRVCAYDRAGLGWSEPSPEPRTSQNIVSELEALLARLHIAGPYVLVGHSFGGFNQRVFASRHRDQVAGMVLVDSSHPDQFDLFPPAARPESILPHLNVGVWTMPFGGPRMWGWCQGDYTFPQEPEAWAHIAPRAIALDCRLSTWRTMRAEEISIRESAREVKATGSLGDLPLIVLSHDPEMGAGFPPADAARAELLWTQMQEELKGLSTNSKRIVAKGSGHYVEVYRPELVVGAIEETVNSARKKQIFPRSSGVVYK
jgi:pimeloyl-ACP methyl ester carboxylesterase